MCGCLCDVSNDNKPLANGRSVVESCCCVAVCVRKHWTIFLERPRDGHRQSDEHWNRFKDNAGVTSERLGGAHTGFSERTDSILN